MARVAEAARFAKLLAMLAHEARLVRTFGDIDPHGDHDRDLPRQARSRAQSPTSASLPLPCASSVADCNPTTCLYVATRGAGAAAFPTKPNCFKERDAAPAPAKLNPTPC